MQTTGFDLAGSILDGTVIERVYFAAPSMYTAGTSHETLALALRQAIGNAEDHVERLRAYNVVDHDRVARAEQNPIYVDVRWEMKSPQGVKTDTVAQRYVYHGLADARDALARIEKYAV